MRILGRTSKNVGSSGILVAISLAFVAFSGCVSLEVQAPNDGSPADVTVHMKDSKFEPATLRINVGSTVTWVNDDSMGHTVTPTDTAVWGTPGSGDAPATWLLEGQSWSFTFTEPGEYDYYCIPHAFKDEHGHYNGMTGKIIVGGEAAPEVIANVIPDPRAPAPVNRTGPARVAIELETSEVVAQLADGVSYEFWTFGGTVPGPMLRIREGDTVDFTLKNAASSQHPHSIDLHAVTGPGGGAKVTQTAPGGSTSFTFKALNPGLYVYHCATSHIPTHVVNGMYGLILVEPGEGLPSVDREYFVVQGEIYTEGALGDAGHQPFSYSKLMSEDPEYFLLNGRVGALTGAGALQANVGETVRLYVGVGGMVPSNFHVIGEIFDRVWHEGAMSAPAENVQTTLIPAGGAAIVEFQVEVPGDYLLVDHWLTHAIDRGAVGILHVEGAADPSVFAGEPSGDGSDGH